jgi:hypothetical protein
MLNKKTRSLWGVVFGILFILSVILFGWRVYRIRNADYGKIYGQLKEYLNAEKGRIAVTLEGNRLCMNYDYILPHDPARPFFKGIKFDPLPGDFLVYVYGSSQIVSDPPFYQGRFPDFAYLLANKLKDRCKIYNFGLPYFDSFDIKEQLLRTINFRKPDLIILYAYVADFDNAYSYCVRNNFYVFRNRINKSAANLPEKFRSPRMVRLSEMADWFLRIYLEPNLINGMQNLHLVKVKKKYFDKYDELITEYYKKNIREMIDSAKSRHIPVVIITPVANLEAKPFGIPEITDVYYKKGLAASDYSEKIKYLIKAKDSEIFTGDMRDKSNVYEFLNEIKEDGVFILDLQQKLLDRDFPFDYSSFYDYCHMKPVLHGIIADYLYEFMKNNSLSGSFAADSASGGK